MTMASDAAAGSRDHFVQSGIGAWASNPHQNRPKRIPRPRGAQNRPARFHGELAHPHRGLGFFQDSNGHGDYTFGIPCYVSAIGQQREHVDWFLEGEQVALVALPTKAVVAAPQGQLGLGGNYYAANSSQANNVGGFLKQGFVTFKDFGSALKVGRFEYFDGNEVKPKDPTLSTLVSTRIAQRLIANFGFSAVQRTFDGRATVVQCRA